MTRQDLHSAIDELLDVWAAQYPELSVTEVTRKAAVVVEMYCALAASSTT